MVNPNIIKNPAIGVAVPVASLIKPDIAIIKPAIAPPKKFVISIGIGLADTISACDKGSILTAIVDLRSPNF